MLQKVKIGGEEITVNGSPLYRVFWGCIDAGIWEPTTLGIILGAARGGVYIDVGAWIGPTALAGALVAEKVVCYEPDPVAAKELRLNLQLNGFDNVELHELALCSHDGTVPFGPGNNNDAMGLSTSSTVRGNLATEVPAKDAREEAKKDIYQHCTLMKIDIEGGEYELVARLAGYLKKRRPTLLLSLHSPFSNDAADLSTAGAIYRRVKGILLRGRLMWHLRHYKCIYTTWSRRLDPESVWVPLAARDALRIVQERGGRELLFSDFELSSIWHPIRPIPQKPK